MLGPAPRVLSPFPHTVYAVHGQTCAVSIGPHDSSKAVRDAACEWGLPNGSRVTTAASSASVNATHRLLTLECPAPLLERRSFSHVRGRGGERRRRGTLTISFDHRTTRKADVIFLADIARPPQQASPVVPSRVHFTSLGGRPLSALLCLAVTTAALIWNPEHLILHVDRPPPKDGAFDCVMTFARLSILPAPPARRRPVQSARPGRCGVGPTCSLVDRRLPNGSVSSLVPYSRLRPVHQNDIVRLDLLLEEGGIYLDADAFALAPLGDLRHFDFSAAHEEFQGVNKVNTGLMIAAPRASFTRLLRDSFESWDGRDWDHQSCVVPWEVLLDHAQERLARLENYPAARWQSRRKRPPRTIGLVGADVEVRPGELRQSYGEARALHFTGIKFMSPPRGPEANQIAETRARSEKLKARGDMLFLLTNALVRMAAAPLEMHTLRKHQSPERALCGAVRGLCGRLRGMGNLLPEERPPFLSQHFPGGEPDCVEAASQLVSPAPRNKTQ